MATNWIVVAARYDASKAQTILAQFASNPGQHHVNALKEFIRYLLATSHFGILFRRTGDVINDLRINFWCDSDFAGNKDTLRSTSSHYGEVCGGAIAHSSSFQNCVTLNVAEAELVAATEGAKVVTFIDQLYIEVGAFPDQHPVMIQEDNKATTILAEHAAFHGRSKHISVQYHWIRERVAEGALLMQHCATVNNKADMGTKLHTPSEHERLRSMIGSFPPADV